MHGPQRDALPPDSYNSLENPIGIETQQCARNAAAEGLLQLIRKPDRD